jgi:hypothetical protein
MRPVLVTTKVRGVFFGYSDCSLIDDKVILTRLRNCLKWGASVGGVFGLAVTGPNDSCTIGVEIPGRTGLTDVCSVSEVTPEAEQAWLRAPCVG